MEARQPKARRLVSRFAHAQPTILASAERVWAALWKRPGAAAVPQLPSYEFGVSDGGHATVKQACEAGYEIYKLKRFWYCVAQDMASADSSVHSNLNLTASGSSPCTAIQASYFQMAVEREVGRAFTHQPKRGARPRLACILNGVSVQFPELCPTRTPEQREDDESRVCHGEIIGASDAETEGTDERPGDGTPAVRVSSVRWNAPASGPLRGAKNFFEPEYERHVTRLITRKFLTGDYGMTYTGVSRAGYLGERDEDGNDVPSWFHVFDLKTLIIELVVHNAAYFKQQSGSITLKIKALPWLDGSAPLHCACPCLQHALHGSLSCSDTVVIAAKLRRLRWCAQEPDAEVEVSGGDMVPRS